MKNDKTFLEKLVTGDLGLTDKLSILVFQMQIKTSKHDT